MEEDGHTIDQCYKPKKKLEKEKADITQEREIVLNISEENNFKEEIWLGDSSQMTFL